VKGKAASFITNALFISFICLASPENLSCLWFLSLLGLLEQPTFNGLVQIWAFLELIPLAAVGLKS